jgi:AbrB family looped-hinge helix DNA binding protein
VRRGISQHPQGENWSPQTAFHLPFRPSLRAGRKKTSAFRWMTEPSSCRNPLRVSDSTAVKSGIRCKRLNRSEHRNAQAKAYNIVRNIERRGKPIRTTAVISLKGQIVIPANLRKRYGMKEGTTVVFQEDHGRLAASNYDAIFALVEAFETIRSRKISNRSASSNAIERTGDAGLCPRCKRLNPLLQGGRCKWRRDTIRDALIGTLAKKSSSLKKATSTPEQRR